MDIESLEDTYEWLDTDENYPLDPHHVFGWRKWQGSFGEDKSDEPEEWLVPYCVEHGHTVREQRTAMTTSTDEERREWITEHRANLVKECVKRETQKQSSWLNRVQASMASKTFTPMQFPTVPVTSNEIRYDTP